MNDELYQIGLPLERLSNVLMNWTCYEPRKIIISPSMKQEDYVVTPAYRTGFGDHKGCTGSKSKDTERTR
ncbi:MAG: hypothetical protein V8Q76_13130 [Bacteroides intestinalis]